ncbi:hypothetical protein ARMSODRAFT_958488 [Armillaria solidipes]|uniref:HNH nuclease domain-containing protein n=1 Tax=Armillaria solidipes TaxID=1076256 RepID=A0A2H3BE13_9AGAR|nr:hypothetical protein ARMSODRAFT_958488 [Armillaria solidipes]
MEDSDVLDYEAAWPEQKGKRMAGYALHLLERVRETDVWKIVHVSRALSSGNSSAQFKAAVVPLLIQTIQESLVAFGCWGMAQAFWKNLSECHPDVPKMVAQLYNNSISPEEFTDVLFAIFEEDTFKLSAITQMATEVYTHLCVAFMNPGGTRSKSGTPATIPESVESTLDDILAEFDATEPWGKRRQQVLKKLVFLRDGGRCPLTLLTFKGFSIPYYSKATLCHIIPNSIASPDKLDPFKMILLFAGKDVAESVRAELNSLGNVVNFDTGISVVFDDLMFGIEAKEENNEVQYYFRSAPGHSSLETTPFRIQPNDRITFGAGPFGEKLGRGPNPKLCNLHWAIVRVANMSGAAEIFREERDEQLENTSALLSTHYLDAQLGKFMMEGRTDGSFTERGMASYA